MGLKFLTNPSMCRKGEVDYFAKDKWPQHDFKTLPLQEASYQTVGKTEKNLSDFELVSSN